MIATLEFFGILFAVLAGLGIFALLLAIVTEKITGTSIEDQYNS